MNAPRLTFLNKLQDRGLVDQWGFAFFAGAGSIGIVIAKKLDAPAAGVALGAVLVMLLYAGLISRFGSGRLRSDQAGDNCYYLGLIYTLASLAYTIFTFDPANTATTIVQGFGIALATTILGLVLRVVFNQGRPDLEEVESGARRELLDAVTRLKTDLGQSVIVMNDFSRQVRQSISETREAATTDITQFAESAISGLKKVIDVAQATLQTEATGFATRSKRQGAAVDRLATSLEKHSDNLDRLSEAQGKMAEAIIKIEESASQARQATSLLATESQEVATSIRSMHESTDTVRETVMSLAKITTDVQTTISKFQTEVNAQIEQLRSAPGAAITEATEALISASATARAELETLRQAQQGATASIVSQAGSVFETFKRHNEALEAELTRSRGMVEKVHTNLVNMTEELVRQVEARR